MADDGRASGRLYMRISPQVEGLLDALMWELGISRTAVVRLAISELARKYHIRAATTVVREEDDNDEG